MEAIKQLKEEHQAVRVMLKILEKISQKLQAGEKVNFDHLDQILEFIKVFVDKCHHKKEEGFLFPSIQYLPIPDVKILIDGMIKDHFILHGIVKEISDCVRDYKAGDQKAVVEIIEHSRSYIYLLSKHADKEDDVLFEALEEHLSDSVQEKLVVDFEKMEINQIGAGKHEELHRMLDRLSHLYSA